MPDNQILGERNLPLAESSRRNSITSRNELQVPHEGSSARLGQNKQLTKIKSLNKLNIKSPLLTPGGTNYVLDHLITHGTVDQLSVSTSRTNQSVRSRIFTAVPDTLYALRNYYDDFTTIDWAKAFTLANKFNYEVKHSKWSNRIYSDGEVEVGKHIPLYFKTYLILSKWILIVLIALCFSLIAYFIDKFEILLVGFKYGYCKSNWFASQVSCCVSSGGQKSVHTFKRNIFKSGYLINSGENIEDEVCEDWISWSNVFRSFTFNTFIPLDFAIYVFLTVILAYFACIITLKTKISRNPEISSSIKQDEFGNDENLLKREDVVPRVMYTASGSGVPEVRTILSGFVIRRFLGTYTLVAKSLALIFAIASGMSLGKEGPYVHLATAVGNILTRFFGHINNNEFLKKQILSASASAGVALAFGSPLGGVLFILEEINNHLPSHHLFQIFICAIVSTLILKFLNPYGTGNTVLFELYYISDWETLELIFFVILGVSGGLFGAAFVKFSRWWPKTFRQYDLIKAHPAIDVVLVALITGVITFGNPYTKQASSELILELATPCSSNNLERSLCPSVISEYESELIVLLIAFIIKVALTFVTFGLKVPSGIYVPSMVAGALFGRLFSMFIQWVSLITISSDLLYSFHTFANVGMNTDSGIYAMIGAGAFMAGVTRMNITLVTILFELTSSYTYVLPIAISIAVANWAGGLLETCSLYEALLIANDYPFMSSEAEPLIPGMKAGDIIDESNLVDQSHEFGKDVNKSPIDLAILPNYLECEVDKIHIEITSSYVASSQLESKLIVLADRNLLDGCVPLIKNGFFVGLIYFSELEFIVDRIREFKLQNELLDEVYCKVLNDEASTNDNSIQLKHHLSLVKKIENRNMDYFNYGSTSGSKSNNLNLLAILNGITNIVDLIDYSPIFLNNDSELSLAHLLFDQIGIRVIVLLHKGKYHGVLHKKAFVDFCRRES